MTSVALLVLLSSSAFAVQLRRNDGDLQASGAVGPKGAEQLVASVFALEQKAVMDNLKKPRLNVTDQDDAAFRRAYSGNTTHELDTAAISAESYGEVSLAALTAAIESLGKNLTAKTFVDLGSGLGRNVIFACAMSGFRTCEGVELSQDRHQFALDALAKFQHLAPGAAKRVKLVHANFITDDDYFNRDIILVDNRFLSDAAIEQIVRKFETVSKRGSMLVATKDIHQLPARVATRSRIHVSAQGKQGKQILFKYTRG